MKADTEFQIRSDQTIRCGAGTLTYSTLAEDCPQDAAVANKHERLPVSNRQEQSHEPWRAEGHDAVDLVGPVHAGQDEAGTHGCEPLVSEASITSENRNQPPVQLQQAEDETQVDLASWDGPLGRVEPTGETPDLYDPKMDRQACSVSEEGSTDDGMCSNTPSAAGYSSLQETEEGGTTATEADEDLFYTARSHGSGNGRSRTLSEHDPPATGTPGAEGLVDQHGQHGVLAGGQVGGGTPDQDWLDSGGLGGPQTGRPQALQGTLFHTAAQLQETLFDTAQAPGSEGFSTGSWAAHVSAAAAAAGGSRTCVAPAEAPRSGEHVSQGAPETPEQRITTTAGAVEDARLGPGAVKRAVDFSRVAVEGVWGSGVGAVAGGALVSRGLSQEQVRETAESDSGSGAASPVWLQCGVATSRKCSGAGSAEVGDGVYERLRDADVAAQGRWEAAEHPEEAALEDEDTTGTQRVDASGALVSSGSVGPISRVVMGRERGAFRPAVESAAKRVLWTGTWAKITRSNLQDLDPNGLHRLFGSTS